MDCVLEPTKAAVLREFEKRKKAKVNPEPFLLKKSKCLFFNTSPLDMKKLMGDQDNIAGNMYSYIHAFLPEVSDIFECFDFHTQVERLAKANLLFIEDDDALTKPGIVRSLYEPTAGTGGMLNSATPTAVHIRPILAEKRVTDKIHPSSQ